MPTKEYLTTRLAALLAGRAAEVVVRGAERVSIGASGDLERVQSLARQMVTKWGMGESLVDSAYSQAYSTLNTSLRELRQATQRLLESDTITGDEVRDILAERLEPRKHE